MTNEERAATTVISRLRYYMSDKVQADDVLRAKAYTALFVAMQDLDIAKWEGGAIQ